MLCLLAAGTPLLLLQSLAPPQGRWEDVEQTLKLSLGTGKVLRSEGEKHANIQTGVNLCSIFFFQKSPLDYAVAEPLFLSTEGRAVGPPALINQLRALQPHPVKNHVTRSMGPSCANSGKCALDSLLFFKEGSSKSPLKQETVQSLLFSFPHVTYYTPSCPLPRTFVPQPSSPGFLLLVWHYHVDQTLVWEFWPLVCWDNTVGSMSHFHTSGTWFTLYLVTFSDW